MILLKKKQQDSTYFNFDKILMKGYHIKEQSDQEIQKFINGNRKEILSSYEDVEITIDFSTFDGATTISYLGQLTSGEYMYYSLKDNTYKNCLMIVEKPTITIESAVDMSSIIVEDFSVALYRSGDA